MQMPTPLFWNGVAKSACQVGLSAGGEDLGPECRLLPPHS